MDKNILLHKLEKFNPDVAMRYERMKQARAVEQAPAEGRPTTVPASQTVDMRVVVNNALRNRREQDSDISRLYSRDNYERNKMVFRHREKEVDTISNNYKVGSTYSAMKAAWVNYETQQE